jgi:hypothetical protein
MAAVFVKAGIKHVLCIQKDRRIDDRAMIFFTELFYRNLFHLGLSICEAFKQTKEKIRSKSKFKDFEFCKEFQHFLLIRQCDNYNDDTVNNKHMRNKFLNSQYHFDSSCDCLPLFSYQPGTL